VVGFVALVLVSDLTLLVASTVLAAVSGDAFDFLALLGPESELDRESVR